MPNIKRGMMGAAGVEPPTGELDGWLWGTGTSGAIGDGTIVDRSSPVQVGETWARISSTNASTHAIKVDGTLWAWGESIQGRLGDGQATIDYSSPIQIGALETWVSLSGQWRVNQAVKTDGTLWAWGPGSYGTLGNGNNINVSSPVQIGSLTDWSTSRKKMSAYKNVAAIKTDGTLWTWGYGWKGMLGTGTANINASSPVQVGALNTWANVTTGYKHCMAIKTDGTLWAWGDSGGGVLGDGQATIDYSSPIQIGALTDWAQVSAGRVHNQAVKTDGTLWGWGSNGRGCLGIGTEGPPHQASSPVQIGALTNWAYVKVGWSNSLAIKTDGTLWAWGEQSVGSLGLGDATADRSSPVQIGSATDWLEVALSWVAGGSLKQSFALRGRR